MRSFIAIELPEEVKRYLSEIQENLKKCGADIRWAKPQNIHLTLKFLGDTGEEDIEEISKRLNDVCGNFNIFNLVITGPGIFPGMRSPRVLWVGLNSNKTIIELQKGIEESIVQVGFKPEKRRFTPHLTIGRFKSSRFKETLLKEIGAKQDMSLGSFEVRSVALIKSDLKPSGAVYTIIREVPLLKP